MIWMKRIHTFGFTYCHPDSSTYEVTIEVEVGPVKEVNKHLATNDWDTQENVSITEILVQDEKGEVVDIDVPDELILHEWQLEQHIQAIGMGSEDTLWENW